MAFSAWRVAVVLTGSNLAGPAMTQFSNQAASANKQINATKASILALRAAALASFAAIGSAMIRDGVNAAAQLQIAMTNVGNATGATRQQLEGLRQTVLSVSGATAQSAVTIAQEMAQFVRSSAFTPKQIQSLFPLVARFADVQFLARGADPVQSVKLGVQMAHYFKAWDPATMSTMLDQLNRLMNVQGEDMQQVVRQAKYFVPMATSLGLNPTQIMQYLALMGQTGFLLGRGGTGMERTLLGAINAPALTAHMQSFKSAALLALGMVDESGHPTYLTDQGGLNFPGLMTGLLAARQKFGPADFARMVYSVFGAQGEQLLMTLADPRVAGPGGQLDKIKAAMARQQNVATQQAQFMATFTGAWNQFATNWKNVVIAVFYPTLPYLTTLFKGWANELQSLATWLTAHPQIGIGIAATAFIAVAGAAAGAAITTWQLIMALRALSVANIAGGASGAAGAAAGAGGGMLARAGGFISGAAGGVGSWLMGLFARRGVGSFPTAGLWPKVVSGAGGLGVGEVGAIALRVFGWVGLIVSALQLLNKLPDLYVAVYNWWARNKEQVYYAIGYAFGEITVALQNGATAMGQFVANTISSLFAPGTLSAIILAAATNNTGQVAALVQAAVSGAAARQATGSSGTFGHYFAKGFAAAHGVHIETNVDIHNNGPVDAATARKHAATIIDHINRNLRQAIRSTPNVSPRTIFSSPGSLGSLGTVHP